MTAPALMRPDGPLRRYGWLAAGQLLVTVLLVGAFFWADSFYTRYLIAERRAAAALTAVSAASTLASAVNERLALVRGLNTFVGVAAHAGTLDAQFVPFADGLRRSVTGVHGVSAAPGFVVHHLHPMEGNERIFGQSLLSDSHPGYAETVQRALVTGDVTVFGPADLVLGGRGLIARQVVFGKDRPWGSVGMVFDLKPILDEARLEAMPQDLAFLLRAENGIVVAGDGAVLSQSPIVKAIPLTDGTWEFALAPRAGWQAAARAEPAYAVFLVVFTLLALMAEALTYQMLSRRRTLERLVERRTGELDSLNQELERFAYVTAHDLQEPLRAIASYTQLLERHLQGRLDEEGAEFIRQIVDGASRLKMLLRDVQLFLAEDRVPLLIRPTAVGEALDGALAMLDQRIRETGAVVTAEGLGAVMADARRLREILAVLLGNAVVYRHPSRAAQITVVQRRGGMQDVIDVRDNGIGIEPQYREQIFEVFRRLHSREEHPGTGMGLAIARKMVERMGGRITLESAPGVGSTFSIHLPSARQRGSS